MPVSDDLLAPVIVFACKMFCTQSLWTRSIKLQSRLHRPLPNRTSQVLMVQLTLNPVQNPRQRLRPKQARDGQPISPGPKSGSDLVTPKSGVEAPKPAGPPPI